jgi:hypothetical protein
MQARHRARCKALLLLATAGICGCTAKAPDKTAAEAASQPEPAAAPSDEAPCEIISAAEANAVPGLQQAGSVGPHRFFAKRRALLCSEPGGGGIGEREIVGATIIRVEGPSGTYGLRSRADVPALLIYGPKGISCVAPSRR